MFLRTVLAGAALVALTAATPPNSVMLPGPQSISEADKATGAKADPEMATSSAREYRRIEYRRIEASSSGEFQSSPETAALGLFSDKLG